MRLGILAQKLHCFTLTKGGRPTQRLLYPSCCQRWLPRYADESGLAAQTQEVPNSHGRCLWWSLSWSSWDSKKNWSTGLWLDSSESTAICFRNKAIDGLKIWVEVIESHWYSRCLKIIQFIQNVEDPICLMIHPWPAMSSSRRVHRCQWISRSPFFRKILDLPRSQQVCLKATGIPQNKSSTLLVSCESHLNQWNWDIPDLHEDQSYLLVSRQNRSKKQCRRKLYRRFHRWDEKAFWWWIGPCALEKLVTFFFFKIISVRLFFCCKEHIPHFSRKNCTGEDGMVVKVWTWHFFT